MVSWWASEIEKSATLIFCFLTGIEPNKKKAERDFWYILPDDHSLWEKYKIETQIYHRNTLFFNPRTLT